MTMETDIPNVVAADSVEMREREEYPAILALRGMGYTITDDPGGWFGIGGGGYDVTAPDGTTSNPSVNDIMKLFTENVEQPSATAIQYYTDKGLTVVPLQDGSYALSDPSNLQKQPIVLTARELIEGYKDDASRRSGDATGAGTTGAAPTGLTGVPFFNQNYQVWSVRYPDGRVEPLEVATDPGLKKIWAYLRTIPVDQIASPTDAQSVLSDAYQYLGQNPITPKAPGEIVRGEDVGGPPGSFFIRQPSGTLTPYTPPTAKEEILTLDQQIAKFVGEGRIDEAMKLDRIRDQLNEERLTPERAAEMLVGISYSPSDFKAMMDAMLGEDSQLDTTVDIGALQEQASAMLRGEVPAAQTVSQMPPFEPPPVFPIPTPRPETALGLEETSVEQAGNIPYIENLLFQQGEQDALMEEGLAPEVVSVPPEQAEPIFTPPEPNRGLPREVAAIGASAMASADRAAMEKAAQDEEIRIIQNTPFASTAEKLKAMEEVMGPRAALYMRNQRLLQPQQQQLFEASRPLTRRYV